MKILCSADYHIKLNTKNIPNDWAKNRFKQLFVELAKIEVYCDMHFMMGDFFDRVPSLEELELYYDFVSSRQITTYIIPGNHEALKKNTTFFSYLKHITQRINNKVQVIDEYWCLKHIDVDIIPYNKLKEFADNPVMFHGDILVTHVRGDIPPHVKAEIDLELLSRWKVVLAGDLHSFTNSQRNIIYPGSPITTSFHRQSVDTGVIIFDTDTFTHRFQPLGLPQLIRKTIQAGEPMLPTEPDLTIYEIEGDMSQLSEVEDHELMDKKVVKRSTDTALILNPEMSIEQEITEYLSYVLMLPEETIQAVLKEYNDHSKNIEME